MSDHAVKELVIIRHRSDDHGDGHHGGVWKIAFADFMTAMMAFFLVMWLINASNEATKKAVASYFNPIKLADVTSNPRGVQDPRFGASSQDSIAQAPERKLKEKRGDQKPGSTSPGTGESLDSPDPSIAAVTGALAIDTGAPMSSGDAGGDEGLAMLEGSASATARLGPPDRMAPRASNPRTIDAPVPASSDGVTMAVAAVTKPLFSPGSNPVAAKTLPAEAKMQAADIGKALVQELAGSNGNIGPSLSVKVVSDGVLISLTDQMGFSMFQVGSAIPNAAMIDALKAVGRVLASRPGFLIVRGHTDGRRYHSETNDNWLLSSDRAHVALDNLIKGGVEERRFERIESFADRKLLKDKDPLASENRRIEILVGPNAQQ